MERKLPFYSSVFLRDELEVLAEIIIREIMQILLSKGFVCSRYIIA